MRILNKLVIILSVSFLLTGCLALKKQNAGVLGKSSKAEDKAKDKITAVVDNISKNDKQKLESIGIFSVAADYSLSKLPNAPKEVIIAREMNARVISLATPPSLEQLKNIHFMIDNLQSSVNQEIIKGTKSLAELDVSVGNIQTDKKTLDNAKDNEIKNYIKVAHVAASKADQYEASVNQMDSWWGLGAVFYGAKRFVTSAIIFLVVFLVIYLVLRLAATTNPIAGAIFSVFDTFASFLIHIIKGIAPGAAKIANLIPGEDFTIYKETLGKIVDTIELIKTADKKSVSTGGTPQKYTIQEILDEIAKSMDQSHKDVITAVKSDTNWK